MKTVTIILSVALSSLLYIGCSSSTDQESTQEENLPEITGYPIVGTNQTTFFNNIESISPPSEGDEFYGQNANYSGNAPQYVNNGDGTVTDMVTGLMWQQSFDHNDDGNIDFSDNLTYSNLLTLVDSGVTFAGYSDWRLPTIKEMYSLILFSGQDINTNATSTEGLTPFIDNTTFEFAYGDLDADERLIDVQCATTNVYVSNEVPQTVFGVNFADGRIKGYGYTTPKGDKSFEYLLVRGNTDYGINKFVDNDDDDDDDDDDDTITDEATGLMWMKDDSGEGMLWKEALAYAEEKEFAGYSDWRLPDVKELQSIVDYTRSLATTNSASIDPIFNATQIINEAGNADYPWYFSSTTHQSMNSGGSAAYVAFGRSLGNMNGWVDIHGAGSQRSDPKTGDPESEQYAEGRGPQGDAIRILNYVRLVRNTN